MTMTRHDLPIRLRVPVEDSSEPAPHSAHLSPSQSDASYAAELLRRGQTRVDRLTTPLTQLTVLADLLLTCAANGVALTSAEAEAHRSALDQAAGEASRVFHELRSLFQPGRSRSQHTDLTEAALVATQLVFPSLAAKGIKTTTTEDGIAVNVAGSDEDVRLVLTSTIIVLGENAHLLRLSRIDWSVLRDPRPVAQFVLQLAAPHDPSLVSSLLAYLEMRMHPLGGFVHVAAVHDRVRLNLVFEAA